MNKQKQVLILIFWLIFSLKVNGQFNYIYIRSFTEVSGSKFVNQLLEDTNNVVLTNDLVFFYSLGIKLEINDIVGWEHPECNEVNDLLKTMNKSGRFYEFPLYDNCVYFDTRTLKSLDSIGYKMICNKYSVDFSPQSFSSLDSILKLEFINDLAEVYNFSEYYKLLIQKRLFQQDVKNEDLNMLFPNKTVFWLKTIDEMSRDEIVKICNKAPGVFLINDVPFNKKNNYSFSELIPFKQISRKCQLTQNVKLKKEYLKECSFRYTDNFSECFNVW